MCYQFDDVCYTVNLPGRSKWTLPSIALPTTSKSGSTERSSADVPLQTPAGETATGGKHSTPSTGTAHARQKRILHQISGSVPPGEMLALLGPSGCGKSTLLNAMAGRVPPECVTGSVRYNGEPFSKSLKRK